MTRLWQNITLRNRPMPAPSVVPEQTDTDVEQVHLATLRTEDSQFVELNAEQLARMNETLELLERKIEDPFLDEEHLMRSMQQLTRLKEVVSNHVSALSQTTGNHTEICKVEDASPKERIFLLIRSPRIVLLAMRNYVHSLVASDGTHRSRSLPAVSGGSSALALMPVARAGTATAAPSRSAVVSLFQTMGQLFAAHVEGLHKQVSRHVDRQKQINDTQLTQPLTRLERLCGLQRTGSRISRSFKASTRDKIITELKKHSFEAGLNAGSYGPLHMAVLSMRPNRVATLLDNGKGRIDVDRVSTVFQNTALGLAIETGSKACVELLLGARAAVRQHDLEAAAGRDDPALFGLLLNHCRSGLPDSGIDLLPAMESAVTLNHLVIARQLLENGLTLTGSDNTLLQMAAQQGHAEMVALLLEHAPKDYHEPNGKNGLAGHPLALALRGGHLGVAKLLLKRHTDRDFVEQAAQAMRNHLASCSTRDAERFTPLITLLENWLQKSAPTAPHRLLQAPPPPAVTHPAVPLEAPLAGRSGRVFPVSHAFGKLSSGML